MRTATCGNTSTRRYYWLMLFTMILPTISFDAFGDAIWADWMRSGSGAPGNASGNINNVRVTYSGELDSAVMNGTTSIWAPTSTFLGGPVDSSPTEVGDAILLNGDYRGTNTITFSEPVENPVIAIWSLGSPSVTAAFNFNATPTVVAGGPNQSYGGTSITAVGNSVRGAEGNGVVQFIGTFRSISWTNTYENYYAFTVGISPSLYLAVSAISDLTGDGIMDQAVIQLKSGSYYLRTINSSSGQQVASASLGNTESVMPVDLTSIGNNISVLLRKGSGANVLQLRDIRTLSVTRTVSLPR